MRPISSSVRGKLSVETTTAVVWHLLEVFREVGCDGPQAKLEVDPLTFQRQLKIPNNCPLRTLSCIYRTYLLKPIVPFIKPNKRQNGNHTLTNKTAALPSAIRKNQISINTIMLQITRGVFILHHLWHSVY